VRKIEHRDRIEFLIKLINRGNCDASTLAKALKELVDQVADLEFGSHKQLRVRLEKLVLNNNDITAYRRIALIEESLTSLKRIVRRGADS
jgi:hypothetical protein